MQKLKNKKEERGRRANFIIQSMIKFLQTYPYIEIVKEQQTLLTLKNIGPCPLLNLSKLKLRKENNLLALQVKEHLFGQTTWP